MCFNINIDTEFAKHYHISDSCKKHFYFNRTQLIQFVLVLFKLKFMHACMYASVCVIIWGYYIFYNSLLKQFRGTPILSTLKLYHQGVIKTIIAWSQNEN